MREYADRNVDLRPYQELLDRLELRYETWRVADELLWQAGTFMFRCPICHSSWPPTQCKRCGDRGVVPAETITTGKYL